LQKEFEKKGEEIVPASRRFAYIIYGGNSVGRWISLQQKNNRDKEKRPEKKMIIS